MHRFLVPDLTHDTVALSEEEAHHAVHVLRARAGERVVLVDGRGTIAEAELTGVDRKGCTAHVLDRRSIEAERKARIHLAVAPTKQIDRFEWFLEKAVEVGVDRVTPLMTTRTERTRLRTDRLLRVAVSAMKQSQRAWLPLIDEPTDLHALLQLPLPAQRFFGWCEGTPRPLMTCYAPAGDCLLLIGPEGDFTPGEADQLTSAGFVPVGLGEARLRTETAALAACTWMSLAQQAR